MNKNRTKHRVFRRAFFRRNSRHLRRLSRLYDWEVTDNGNLRPIVDANRVERSATPRSSEHCSNDSYILEKILHKYNPHKIPGGHASVEVEVWVQEITTISDITSDFQVMPFKSYGLLTSEFSWTFIYQRCGSILFSTIRGCNLVNII